MKVQANGIAINYELAGSGPCVILSHSIASNLHMWDEQMDALTARYTVLRYDTRGHGATAAPDGAYSFAQLVGDVAGLLDALNIERTHFVGLSMGGMIAQHFALAHPGRLDKLVIASSSSRTPPEARAIWDERIALARDQGMQAHVEATLGRWFTASWRASHPEVMARIGGLITATPVAGYAGCCHALPKLNLTARLKDIKVPALVIVGDQDAGTPPAMAQAIHENLPGSDLEIIASASHLSNVEQPAAFDRALTAFYNRIKA